MRSMEMTQLAAVITPPHPVADQPSLAELKASRAVIVQPLAVAVSTLQAWIAQQSVAVLETLLAVWEISSAGRMRRLLAVPRILTMRIAGQLEGEYSTQSAQTIALIRRLGEDKVIIFCW